MIHLSGIGNIEDINEVDPKELPSKLQILQYPEQFLHGVAELKLFRFVYHPLSSPLLIDRPPPGITE
ncbi:MAG: hypothetical protein QNK35_05595 [Bacteroides sp.]|nr:hypothetical protein [Bacteroides sp.]